MNILQINTELKWSGGEGQTFSLVRGLIKRGHRITLVAQPQSIIGKRVRTLGIPVVEIWMRNHLDINAIFKLHRLMKHKHFDIIHLHTSRAHALGAIAARFLKTKVVVTRRMDFPVKKNFLNKLLYQRWTDEIIVISRKIEKILIDMGIDPNKIVYIPSGVDLKRFTPEIRGEKIRNEFNIDSFLIGTVAALVERKGLSYFIEAARDVSKKSPTTRFIIVGDGSLKEKLKRYSEKLGMEERIIFAGFREDIPELIASLDVFVLSSLQEGLGVSILEAEACGKPVVASNVGGIPDCCIDGITGFLIPPRDSKALTKVIITLLQDKEKRTKMGKAGRRLVEKKFSMESMIRENEKIYFEIMK
jgi:glycosyltransferase involved in cell wall biosynthesis